MIRSPYNFVPLSDKVVTPFWANYVSHDIPFKESHSGTLKMKIKAKSPIYVRNGIGRNSSKEDKKRFNQFGNQFFIPGSSIRGMLRSVVEIMSFEQIGNKVDDTRYSVRDFQNDTIYPKTEISKNVECGWLYNEGGKYFLDQCGEPGRISHRNLDILCSGEKMSEYYKSPSNVSNDKMKSAKAKYDAFPFEKENHKFIVDYEDMGRKVLKIDQYEGREGTIVLTGQPGVRKEPQEGKASGKHLEFVFFPAVKRKEEVDDVVIKNFLFAYYDHDKTNQKDDWKWRSSQLSKGKKIPVFFRKNSDGTIKDMGLTMLFKITYENSVRVSTRLIQGDTNEYGLAETIFGYTGNDSSLKGRVQIGHAFMSMAPKPMEEVQQVLGGPKASYYPNYIEQRPKADGTVTTYQTFMDGNAAIRGWKRYPVRNGPVKHYDVPKRKDGSVNNDVVSSFIPLPVGTEFTFDIHYHNLRKEELGALISAITFHNTDGLFHSIGSAKPLGYGKISLTIKDGISKDERVKMLSAFEAFMDYSLGNSTPLWFQSEQIKELMAMAKPGNDDSKLEYMKLAEFSQAKGRGKHDPRYALLRYSQLSGNSVLANTLLAPQDLKEASIKYEREKEVYSKLKTVEAVKNAFINKWKNELNDAIEKKKAELLAQLEIRKQELTERQLESQKAVEDEERKRKAQSGLPDGWHSEMGFDNLEKRVPRWQKNLIDAEIPESFQIVLYNLLTGIIENDLSKSKTKRKWQNEKDVDSRFEKITDWIGKERASALRKKFFGE